jgi:hypothetical protein
MFELTMAAWATDEARVEFRGRSGLPQSIEQRVWAVVTACGEPR